MKGNINSHQLQMKWGCDRMKRVDQGVRNLLLFCPSLFDYSRYLRYQVCRQHRLLTVIK